MRTPSQSTGPPPRLQDRYRLVEWLGEGGMGTVYRAHDETLGRDVAVKFLSPARIKSVEARERFLREARIVAQLSHPNIMTLYDVGTEGAWSYLVLEYISGQDLQSLIAARVEPLPWVETLRISRGILQALAYAHGQGVIHRDIKPENVMIETGGQVKVTDFGLSLAQGEERLTEEDTILGTVLYLAPEVVGGEAAGQGSDLYAVGAVLYEMLTGRPPFPGDRPATIFSQILHSPLTPPRLLNPAIPVELEQVVVKLLAKDPPARYPTAAAVLAALPRPAQPIDTITGSPAPPPQALSLLERIARSSSAQHRSPAKVRADEGEPSSGEFAASPEALLLYAALEDMTTAVEAERRRVAGLLNQQVVEALNLLLAQANAYEQSLGATPTARMAVSVLASLTKQVMQQVRDLEANLHPSVLESLGLEPALETLANQAIRAHGLNISLLLERLPHRSSGQIELAIFRAAQIALERSVHQAHASQISIKLGYREGLLRFSFADNGVGTETLAMFQTVRRRVEQLGGQIELEVKPQQGLTMRIEIDLNDPAQLTPREMEVIQLLVEGLSNKEIARQLSIKPRTVNFHLDNIYTKLDINSRTEAAIYALRQGWGHL